MDNLTHTLFALTLARTSLGRAGRGTTPALVIASNAPDIDIIATAGGAINYLRWHRGPTHGPLGVIGLGLLTAALVWVGRRLHDRYPHFLSRWVDAARQPRTEETNQAVRASFIMLVVVSMVGVLFHILMDLPTSYGTRVLSPFDWHWYSTDWMPIVDVYLLIALSTGLAFGRGSDLARRRNAAIVFVFMAANYGVRAAEHYEALSLAPRLFGPLLPRSCDSAAPRAPLLASWPRNDAAEGSRTARVEIDDAAQDRSGQAPGRCLIELAALPNVTSPFEWRVIAQLSNAYELHDVGVLDSRFSDPESNRDAFWRVSLRYPNQWTDPVFRAARTRIGEAFLGFSRFPAARSSVDRDSLATVRWSDMRFVGGNFTLDQPGGRRTNQFTAMVRIGPDGAILLESLGR